MTEMHPLVAQLAEARKTADMSISEVAICAGMPPSTPWYWEHGTVPSLAKFEAYANVLGFDVVLAQRGLPPVVDPNSSQVRES